METINFLITGVGGQGTVLASEIMAAVGLAAGYDVKKSDLLGLSVRGGAVLGHVRWGETVYSPIVPEGRVDYLVAFEQLEALRHLGQVKSSGTILVNQQKIYPVLVSSGLAEYPSDEVIETSLNRTAKAIYKIPAVDLALGIGNSKVLNIVLLGALSSLFDIEAAVWEKVLEERVPKKFTELNIQAFREGRNWMKGK
ncbi:indolepyruvate oxidoreductase subunit beta [Flexilinea flocculi]|uniref:Pyruvate:ferredoxin oxidoreductase n=1 Tax=Flexilinea flocculi TaxID=1678840 RepID=A0A0K8PAX5_9CHLR|nr:indolepyruvate oxidoreductase subunit beta [Flexilinea flocculi]GAP39300.1 pyruvate:ferredoxin oxidoreductase [Flexilinea flocculi]